VTDEVQLARARVEGPVPWAPGIKEYLIRVPPTLVTGRRLGVPGGGTAVVREVRAVP
jgi:hypothetical protein